MPIESYRVIDETPSMTGGEIIGTPIGDPLDTTRNDEIPADGAMLVVSVPAGARVFVNDSATSSTGELRRYLSRGLEQGRRYEFVVRMAVDRDGQTREETKVVNLVAGRQARVAFDAEPVRAAAAVPTTSLTLRVPENAQVWLAGNATASSGPVRQFETTGLRAGQTWKNYEIRVTAVVDGREQSVSKVIDLAAGDTVEFALDPTARTATAGSTAALR
jgi:uncharacterized protein (TIGR03000 family)